MTKRRWPVARIVIGIVSSCIVVGGLAYLGAGSPPLLEAGTAPGDAGLGAASDEVLRSIADLAAQERMAQAAERTLWVSIWQAALATAGAIGLFWTIYLTRRSIVVASEATRTSERLGHQQLRAYVDLKEAEYSYTGRVVSTTLVFENTGQTPAVYFRVKSSLEIQLASSLLAIPANEWDFDRLWPAIGAGRSQSSAGPFVRDVDPSVLTRSRIVVRGVVEYRDIFDVCFSTEFIVFGGPGHGNVRLVRPPVQVVKFQRLDVT